MKTWAEVKQMIENAGVKDVDKIRSFSVDLDTERNDFSRVEMKMPAERTRSLDSH